MGNREFSGEGRPDSALILGDPRALLRGLNANQTQICSKGKNRVLGRWREENECRDLKGKWTELDANSMSRMESRLLAGQGDGGVLHGEDWGGVGFTGGAHESGLAHSWPLRISCDTELGATSCSTSRRLRCPEGSRGARPVLPSGAHTWGPMDLHGWRLSLKRGYSYSDGVQGGGWVRSSGSPGLSLEDKEIH